MRIDILRKGDQVISVTKEFIAVQRKNGEVDIVPIIMDGAAVRVDTENITTIGFGEYVVQTQVGNVTVTTF